MPLAAVARPDPPCLCASLAVLNEVRARAENKRLSRPGDAVLEYKKNHVWPAQLELANAECHRLKTRLDQVWPDQVKIFDLAEPLPVLDNGRFDDLPGLDDLPGFDATPGPNGAQPLPRRAPSPWPRDDDTGLSGCMDALSLVGKGPVNEHLTTDEELTCQVVLHQHFGLDGGGDPNNDELAESAPESPVARVDDDDDDWVY